MTAEPRLPRRPRPLDPWGSWPASPRPESVLAALVEARRRVAALTAELADARQHAYCDALTGLANRHVWQSALLTEGRRTTRYGGSVSVLALDLDDLKRTNDVHGHVAGDAALARCADVLRGTCRPGDVVARLGGDEFGVLALACDERASATLRARLAAELAGVAVRASVGAATRSHGESLASTWQRADRLMYADKDLRRRTGAVALR